MYVLPGSAQDMTGNNSRPINKHHTSIPTYDCMVDVYDLVTWYVSRRQRMRVQIRSQAYIDAGLCKHPRMQILA